MQFKLLVIDDDLDTVADALGRTRRDFYLFLGDKFEIEFLEKLSDLSEFSSAKGISAVLLDFVLAKWGTDALSVLPELDSRLPVGLISQHWSPNFEKLRQALDSYSQVAQIFTWDDLANIERRGLIAMWLIRSIHRAEGLSLSNIGDSDPIRILHLSDLQFGSPVPADFHVETALAGEAIRRRWGGAPTFIALTGDVAERGLPSEYHAAQRWLTQFATELDQNWVNDRFLLIPGNHDLCWPLAWSACIDVANKQLKVPGDHRELGSFILEPFRNFAGLLGGEGSWSGDTQYWTSGRHRRIGIILFGCNSCEEVDDWGKPQQTIPDRTLANMLNEVRQHQKDAPGALRIGLIHHPLNADNPSETLRNRGSLLKGLSDQDGDVLILCGHVHSNEYGLFEIDGVRVLELTASSATKSEKYRPPDSLRSFSLLTLERKDNRIIGLTVELCRFERHRLDIGQRRAFKRLPDGRFEKQRTARSKG